MEQQTVTIQDKAFVIPAPYSEGHVLAANEAAALNQLFAENVRNNFAAKLKKAKEEGKTLGQSDLDEYTATYSFGVRVGGASRLDPVERLAREMAEEQVKKMLKAKGVKIKDAEEAGKIDEFVDKLLEKYPAIREQAAKVHAARSSVVGDISLD